MALYARKGIGQQHTKWSPVSTCVMRKQPYVYVDADKVNRQMTLPQKKKFVASCPRKVFKFDEFKSLVDIEDASKCIQCGECNKYAGIIGKEKAVDFGETADCFAFEVESTGALDAADIVLRAFSILVTKLNNFQSSIYNMTPQRGF